MITADIAGYTFNDHNFCVECTHVWAIAALERESYRPDKPLTEWTTEGLLNVLAALCDVDRDYAESDNFPVPFSRTEAMADRDRSLLDDDLPVLCAGRACGNDFLGEF